MFNTHYSLVFVQKECFMKSLKVITVASFAFWLVGCSYAPVTPHHGGYCETCYEKKVFVTQTPVCNQTVKVYKPVAPCNSCSYSTGVYQPNTFYYLK